MTTGFSGRLLVIKKATATSPATLVTIAALKDTTVTLTNAAVDITNKDSAGFTELLDGKTVVKLAVSGTGVFSDAQVIGDLQADALAGTHNNYTIDIVNSGATTAGVQYACACRVVSFVASGNFGGEVQYTIALESTGTITAT